MKIRETAIFEKTRELFLLFDYVLWALLDPSKFKKIRRDEIKKVLIIHFGAIGEILVLTPLISALKKELNCEIGVMVKGSMSNIFKDNPYVSKILIFKKSFKENLKILKKENFDLAFIINPASFKMAFLCLKAGIRYRIGGFSGLKRFPAVLFTRRVLHLSKKHSIEHILDILGKINIKNKSPKIEFYFSKEAAKTAKKKLKELGVKDYIIVHPGFGKKEHPSRLWPPERYAKVIDYLIEKYSFSVLLTGALEEKPITKRIYKMLKNRDGVKLTNGLFRLDEMGFVVSKAKLLIAPSTSIIHIASAFNVPIVNLISKKRDIYEWHPWMEKGRYKILFSSKTRFNPNVPTELAEEGMLGITEKNVIHAVESLLKNL